MRDNIEVLCAEKFCGQHPIYICLAAVGGNISAGYKHNYFESLAVLCIVCSNGTILPSSLFTLGSYVGHNISTLYSGASVLHSGNHRHRASPVQ